MIFGTCLFFDAIPWYNALLLSSSIILFSYGVDLGGKLERGAIGWRPAICASTQRGSEQRHMHAIVNVQVSCRSRNSLAHRNTLQSSAAIRRPNS